MDWTASIKRGTLSGARVLWELAKVIVPAMIVINVLEKTGWLARLSVWLGPLMGLVGLPGEAALALVSANFVSTYAGLAVLVALALPVKETTILAVMMLINHAAISETALVAKTGAKAGLVLLTRTVAMVIVALVLNWTLPS